MSTVVRVLVGLAAWLILGGVLALIFGRSLPPRSMRPRRRGSER